MFNAFKDIFNVLIIARYKELKILIINMFLGISPWWLSMTWVLWHQKCSLLPGS